MKIVVNGQEREMPVSTVADVIRELGLAARPVAAMVNGAVVKRANLATHVLQPDDRVELISLIGGG